MTQITTIFGAYENPSATAIYGAVSAGTISSGTLFVNGEQIIRDDVTLSGVNGTLITATASTNTIRIRAGGFFISVTSVSSSTLPLSSYTISSNTLILTYGTLTANLPPPSGLNGRLYFLKFASTAGTLTVKTVSGLIDGTSASLDITTPNTSVTFASDNSNWWII